MANRKFYMDDRGEVLKDFIEETAEIYSQDIFHYEYENNTAFIHFQSDEAGFQTGQHFAEDVTDAVQDLADWFGDSVDDYRIDSYVRENYGDEGYKVADVRIEIYYTNG